MESKQSSIKESMEGANHNRTEGNPFIMLPDDFKETQEFKDNFNLIENKENDVVCIMGEAGAGKSTFSKYLAKYTKKNLVILASTGVGALNVGGQTIHSFFQLPPKFIQKTDIKQMRHKKQLLSNLDTIIIDEVSMVRADLMDAVDCSLRLNLDRPETPFGGVKIVLVGDMCQLPPVEERNLPAELATKYKTPYFFDAHVFDEVEVIYTELKHQYRQKDSRLVDILNKIRTKSMNDEDLGILNQRFVELNHVEATGDEIMLTMTNEVAADINKERLESLRTEEYCFEAKIHGKFYAGSAYPTDEKLVLKKGAKVMLLRNDPDHRWVNGTMAIVERLSKDSVEVLINGNVYDVPKFRWERLEYMSSRSERSIYYVIAGSFEQYPLKLAWAITVHKSQGQTFDNVAIDRGRGAFAHGQMYVALSRCRTLDGIILSDEIYPEDFIFDHRVNGFKDKFKKHI